MAKTDWRNCTDAIRLLRALRNQAGERRLRLFACGCVRRVWHLLADDRSRRAIEVAERYADGEATPHELSVAREAAQHAATDAWKLFTVATFNAMEEARSSWLLTAAAFSATADSCRGVIQDRTFVHGPAQAILLRCIGGRKLLQPSPLEPAWVRWNDGLLVSMARRMYELRDFTDLPILADALEEAGCTSAAVLDHCRNPGEHIRGCWVVDWVLGKE